MDEHQLRKDLADFYRVMAYFGWGDLIFTATSVEIPGTGHFLIKRYKDLYQEVTPENLVKVDIDGNVVEGNERMAIETWPVHKALHTARPDCPWSVHWHSPDVNALSADPRGVLPISQHAMVVRAGGVCYHKYGGPVMIGKEYEDFVREMNCKLFAVMRNHGASIVAENVSEAFWNTYSLQKAAEVQVRSVEFPVLVDADVEKGFAAKYEMFRAGIPKDGLWDAMKRLATKN